MARLHASAVLRRVPAVAAGTLLGLVLAILLATRLPPTYEAEAALLVALPPGTALPAPSHDATEALPLLDQRIRARATAAAAARALGGGAPAAKQPAGAAHAEEDPAVSPLHDGMQARIVTVGLKAPGPQQAAAAANEMAGLLLREATERRGGVVATPPPPEEAERLSRKVGSQGAALQDFLDDHAGALPDTLETRRAELAAEEARLGELGRAEAAVAAPRPTDDPAGGDDLATQQGLGGGQGAEARVAALRASIEATAANADRLVALRQEFEALRSDFERVTQRHLAAGAGDLVDLLAASSRVSVIALAVPPAMPAGPNRPLILAAGLLGGLLLGLALAALLEARDRSIRRPGELVARLGIEPFAVLPVLRGGRGRTGIAALFLLPLLVAGLWAIHLWMVPLDRVVGQLLAAMGAAEPGDG